MREIRLNSVTSTYSVDGDIFIDALETGLKKTSSRINDDEVITDVKIEYQEEFDSFAVIMEVKKPVTRLE